MDDALRKDLQLVAALLEEARDYAAAARVQDAVSGSQTALEEFLKSNALWGGAGSIADQGCLTPDRSGRRRELERLLIRIGHWQLQNGLVNPRTERWLSAFEGWSIKGI